MRKLASIRRITDVHPIENADAIECVIVDGWQVVSKKGEFNVGDPCIFFEVDSFLPVREEFEFLRKNCFRSIRGLGDGFRLKTVKLRGQISQGLVLPVSDFFPISKVVDELEPPTVFDGNDLMMGADLTEVLGVVKYEIPEGANLGGRSRGNFPIWIPKTDQERVQNVYGAYKRKYPDMEFEATLKMEGSSMTVYHYNDGEQVRTGVCSRNLDLVEGDANLFWQCAKKYNLIELIKATGFNVAIQGELMGPGVQGNNEGFEDHHFFLFDIWHIDLRRYLTPNERMWFVNDHLQGVEIAPFLGFMKPFQMTMEELLAFSDRPSLRAKMAEGVVYKSLEPMGPSFKVISNRYLLQDKA